MNPTFDTGLMWFRRDLRAEDNAALYHALRSCRQLHCVFVFDSDILACLPRRDRRIEFIRESLVALHDALCALAPGNDHAGLIVVHARATEAIPALAKELGAQAVFSNRDYEPAAVDRDASVAEQLGLQGIGLRLFKDQTIFECDEVLTLGGTPYGVFTPYKNAWLRKVDAFYLKPYPVAHHAKALAPRPAARRGAVPPLTTLGFEPTDWAALQIPAGSDGARALFANFQARIGDYADARNRPGVRGTSYLSVHLRFGTISVRALAAQAHRLAQAGNTGAEVWLSELIWRDFYFQVLHHHPKVGTGHSYKPEYDNIGWETGPQADALFTAWCEGRTGYPLVDAAMAQINQTGFMHNRLRMVTASFLCKDLGLDWRRGEAYFAEKLNDFDLSANNGGWQWASSSGCDAQPYFRVFNPVMQSEKFDAKGAFIRHYLPQLAALPDRFLHAPWKASAEALQQAGVVLGKTYPRPIIDHAAARDATRDRYAVVKKPKSLPTSEGA